MHRIIFLIAISLFTNFVSAKSISEYSCDLKNKKYADFQNNFEKVCLSSEKDSSFYSMEICVLNGNCFNNEKVFSEEYFLFLPDDIYIDDDIENKLSITTQDNLIVLSYKGKQLFVEEVWGFSRNVKDVYVNGELSSSRPIKVMYIKEKFENFNFQKYLINSLPSIKNEKGIYAVNSNNIKSYSPNQLLNFIYSSGIHDENIDKVKLIIDHLSIISNAPSYALKDLVKDVDKLYPNRNKKFFIRNKTYLFSFNKGYKKTKMYLIKGDKVTILDEKTDDSDQKWYFINYKGTKDLTMWIKAEAVDIPQTEETPNQEKVESQPQSEAIQKPSNSSNTANTSIKEQIPDSLPTKRGRNIKAQQESIAGGSLPLSLLASLLGVLAFKLS